MPKPIVKTATAFDRLRLDRIVPIPGAVWRDRKWKVTGVESGGRTDITNARMEADHNDNIRGQYTRAHEMVHTVISPEMPPQNKDGGEAYVLFEEVQVHQYMKSALDLPDEAYEQHEQDKQAVMERTLPAVKTMTRRQRALVAIACGDEANAADLARITTLLEDEKDAAALLRLINEAVHATPRPGRGYSDMEHAAQEAIVAKFELLFAEPADAEEEPEPEPDEDTEGEDEDSEAEGEGGEETEGEGDEEDEADPEEAAREEEKRKERERKKGEKQKEDYKRHGEAAKWGPMEIETPPLVTPSKALRLLQKRRPLDTGSHIRHLTRLVSDGFIFGEKMRVQGGTILVDTSGSMAIDQDDIQHLLDTAPAAKVAIYAEADRYSPMYATKYSGPYGILRVVVDKARMAAKEYLRIGNGNLVDGPALEWLEKQPEPRFWISDGYVIGSNGSGVDHIRYCAHICKRGRILRLNDIPSAIARLTGKPVVK